MCVAIYQSQKLPKEPAAIWKEELKVRAERARPTDEVAALVHTRGNWYGGTMPWGYPTNWSGKSKLLLYARFESMHDRPFWSRWNACVIPANGFIERNTIGTGTKYYLFTSDSSLWLAGLWKRDDNGNSKLVVVTQKPSRFISPIHDRMPVCMETDFIGQWVTYKKCPEKIFFLEASPLDKL